MIDHAILSELYTELGQVMEKAASFERQLETESQNNYGRLASLHRAISETMLRIRHIKDRIAVLEAPDEPVVTITSMDANELAELSKTSPEVGIGWDENRQGWRFRKRVDGKRKTIARAPTHAEIVALKRDWEQKQRTVQ